MIGNVDLLLASKDSRLPRWVKLLHVYLGWRRVIIEPVNAKRLQQIVQRRPRKAVVAVNRGAFSVFSRRASMHGLFIPIPNIRNAYLIRYADRHLRK